MVTVNLAEPVRGIVEDDGLTPIEKSPLCVLELCTTSGAPTDCVSEPLVPVIVNG